MNGKSSNASLTGDPERPAEFEAHATIKETNDENVKAESPLHPPEEGGATPVEKSANCKATPDSKRERLDRLLAKSDRERQAARRQNSDSSPAVAPIAAIGGIAPPAAPGEADSRADSRRLEDLRAKIVSEISGLRDVLSNALARKLKLGELLVEARDLSKSLGEDWMKLLESFGINERSAREAIQFYRRKDEIEKQRHGGAVLSVTTVRAGLAQPRERASKRTPVVPREAIRGGGVEASTRSLPPPASQGQDCGGVVGVVSASGRADDDGLFEADRSSTPNPIATGIDPDDHLARPLPDRILASSAPSQGIVEFAEGGCAKFVDFLEVLIERLGEGVADRAIRALERDIPKMIAGLERLDAAVQGRRSSG